MYQATRQEMQFLDDTAVDNGLEIRQMMELAGWLMISLFEKVEIGKSKKICVLAGKGNKGGDGLCATRHLVNHGWPVKVILGNGELKKDPLHHLKLLEKMKVETVSFDMDKKKSSQIIRQADWVIDALVGYNLEGALREQIKRIVEIVKSLEKKVVAYDLPTGLDATEGNVYPLCVRAQHTLTLALLKKGLVGESQTTGQLWLGDIGIASFIYDKVKPGIKPDFNKGENGLIKL